MAIVVPDVEVIKHWAVENNIPGTLSVLCSNPDVKQLILNDMLAWGKEYGLKSFEQVRAIMKLYDLRENCVTYWRCFRLRTFTFTRIHSRYRMGC